MDFPAYIKEMMLKASERPIPAPGEPVAWSKTVVIRFDENSLEGEEIVEERVDWHPIGFAPPMSDAEMADAFAEVMGDE